MNQSKYREHLHGGEACHYDRYCLAAEWIEPFMVDGAEVLELGGVSPFTGLLEECWPEAWISTTLDDDLRNRFFPADGTVDLVLCMEVIEHMKDRLDDDRSQFCWTGVRNLLNESFRVLRPGGRLFLSTPNLSSYVSLWRQIQGGSPFWFKPHVRELGALETKWLIEKAGFGIERFEGVAVWEHEAVPLCLQAMIDGLGDKGIPREACLFVMARKPL